MPLSLITLISRDKPNYCLCCFKPLLGNNLHELIREDINICPTCLKELGPIRKLDKINDIKGEYIFTYTDKTREKIYTLKGCYDIELARTFINYFKLEFKIKYKGYYIVPSPSDIESDTKRGFNHVVEIFKPLGLPILPVIKKRYKYKQSDLSKSERENVINKLELIDPNKIRGKKILFVDDISTTGSTLRACLSLIKKSRPKKVKFLIIAKVNNNSNCNKITNKLK